MGEGKKFLAFDLGASSGRVMLGYFFKDNFKIKEIHRFDNCPVAVSGTIYWDVLKIFKELKKGLLKFRDLAGEKLSGIGVDSWGVDFGLLDKKGKLIENPVHYRDERTNGMMEEAFKLIPREKIFEETGIQFMQINTLYQLFALKQSKSMSLKIVDRLLLMVDLFNFFLIGESKCEFTLATTSQAYNPIKNSWSSLIFEKLNLPYEIMPEVVASGTVIGELLPSIRKEIKVQGKN